MFSQLASVQKFLVSALGMVLTVLAFTDKIPFLPGPWHVVVVTLVAVLTPIMTWLVPNKPAKVASE